MKNLALICFFFFAVAANAQQLNEKGLYTDSEGNLFSGVITAMNSGIKSEMEVKDGIIHGKASYFYASGKLMESGMMAMGLKDGQWTRYTENGLTSAVGFYSAGKKSGTWLVFDENNKKRMEMNYTNGEKSGTWTSWDENGAIAGTKNYGEAN
jgi:antitoxin component YwqK of YwqJK toxin-antitoxin module